MIPKSSPWPKSNQIPESSSPLQTAEFSHFRNALQPLFQGLNVEFGEIFMSHGEAVQVFVELPLIRLSDFQDFSLLGMNF